MVLLAQGKFCMNPTRYRVWPTTIELWLVTHTKDGLMLREINRLASALPTAKSRVEIENTKARGPKPATRLTLPQFF